MTGAEVSGVAGTGEAGEREPVPSLLSAADFRRLAVEQGYTAQQGGAVFNVLVRGAEEVVDVDTFAGYEPPAPLPDEPPMLRSVRLPGRVRSEDRWRVETANLVQVLEHWLAKGHPDKFSPPVRQMGPPRLGFVAATLNYLFPERERPFPLPPDYPRSDERANAVYDTTLFETVTVRGVTRWLVTHRAISDFLARQGRARRTTQGVARVMGYFAGNLMARDGARLPDDAVLTLDPKTPVAEGVVFLGPGRSDNGKAPRPVYGIDPGAFLDELARADAVDPETIPVYGPRIWDSLDRYAVTLRGMVRFAGE